VDLERINRQSVPITGSASEERVGVCRTTALVLQDTRGVTSGTGLGQLKLDEYKQRQTDSANASVRKPNKDTAIRNLSCWA